MCESRPLAHSHDSRYRVWDAEEHGVDWKGGAYSRRKTGRKQAFHTHKEARA